MLIQLDSATPGLRKHQVIPVLLKVKKQADLGLSGFLAQRRNLIETQPRQLFDRLGKLAPSNGKRHAIRVNRRIGSTRWNPLPTIL